jgi:hypothetical protein
MTLVEIQQRNRDENPMKFRAETDFWVLQN